MTSHLHLQPEQVYAFDTRGIAQRFRHAAIFGALDAVFPGEAMRFCNPLPLLAQVQARYGEAISTAYDDLQAAVRRLARGTYVLR